MLLGLLAQPEMHADLFLKEDVSLPWHRFLPDWWRTTGTSCLVIILTRTNGSDKMAQAVFSGCRCCSVLLLLSRLKSIRITGRLKNLTQYLSSKLLPPETSQNLRVRGRTNLFWSFKRSRSWPNVVFRK